MPAVVGPRLVFRQSASRARRPGGGFYRMSRIAEPVKLPAVTEPEERRPSATTGDDRRKATRRRGLGAFLLYVLLAVLVTWPLAGRIATGVPHDLVDPLLNTWVLWWNTQAVPFTQRVVERPLLPPRSRECCPSPRTSWGSRRSRHRCSGSVPRRSPRTTSPSSSRSPSRRRRCTSSPAGWGSARGRASWRASPSASRPSAPRTWPISRSSPPTSSRSSSSPLTAIRRRGDGGGWDCSRRPGSCRDSPAAISSCTCRCCSVPGWRGSFARCPIAAGRPGCCSRGPWPWPASHPSSGAIRAGTPSTASSGASRRSSISAPTSADSSLRQRASRTGPARGT